MSSGESSLLIALEYADSYDISLNEKYLAYSTNSGVMLVDLLNFDEKKISDLRSYDEIFISPTNNSLSFRNFKSLYIYNFALSKLNTILNFELNPADQKYRPIYPKFSHDGNRITFIKFYDGYPYNFNESYISIINTDGSKLFVSNRQGNYPRFLPDDSDVIYDDNSALIGLYNGTFISGFSRIFPDYKFSTDCNFLVFKAYLSSGQCDLFLYNIKDDTLNNLTNTFNCEHAFDIIQITQNNN